MVRWYYIAALTLGKNTFLTEILLVMTNNPQRFSFSYLFLLMSINRSFSCTEDGTHGRGLCGADRAEIIGI